MLFCVLVVFTMADSRDQRRAEFCLLLGSTGTETQRRAEKFCFLLGSTGTETLEMLKTAHKNDAMGKTQVFKWFPFFKEGEMLIDDQPRSGRPSTPRTD